MKFGIVGAGAMGCLLGGFLAKAQEEVWLIDVWEEHIKEINKNGLQVVQEDKGESIPINSTFYPQEVGLCDVVIVSTKFHNTRAAVENALPMIGPETLVMTIQNGIGNVEIISEFVPPQQILFGLTTLGSVVLKPGENSGYLFKRCGNIYLAPRWRTKRVGPKGCPNLQPCWSAVFIDPRCPRTNLEETLFECKPLCTFGDSKAEMWRLH